MSTGLEERKRGNKVEDVKRNENKSIVVSELQSLNYMEVCTDFEQNG